MQVDTVVKNRNVALTVTAVAFVITLLVFASAVVEIRAPGDSGFSGPGYIYTVEYQCGTQTASNDPKAQPGKYSTNILIHNPFTEEQDVFIKILPVTGKPISSEWLNKTSTITTPWVIRSNGALEIDCDDITTVGGDVNNLGGCCPAFQPQVFSKGLLVISHPVPGDGTGVLIKQPLFDDESLDVTVSYTYFSNENPKDRHFNKVVCKVRDITADRTVTDQMYELLIETNPAMPLVNLKGKVKDALTAQGVDLSYGFKIIEVSNANYAATGSVGIGASKDVETIKGKFVPFVPVPEETLFF